MVPEALATAGTWAGQEVWGGVVFSAMAPIFAAASQGPDVTKAIDYC